MRVANLSQAAMAQYHGCGAAVARVVKGVAVEIVYVGNLDEKDEAEERFGDEAEFGMLSCTEFCYGDNAIRREAMAEL